MLRMVKLFLFIFSFSVITTSAASELTEDAVKNIILKVDSAVSTLNAQKVADTMSSNVEITMYMSIQGKNQVIRPSKKEYLAMLQQGWDMYKNYKYNRSSLEIHIKNNKALVTAHVNESMTVQGQQISAESKEEVTIELVGGNPLITKVTGYTSM